MRRMVARTGARTMRHADGIDPEPRWLVAATVRSVAMSVLRRGRKRPGSRGYKQRALARGGGGANRELWGVLLVALACADPGRDRHHAVVRPR